MTSESVYLFSAVALLLPQYPHRSSQLILPISRITAMASHNAPAGSNVVVQKAGGAGNLLATPPSTAGPVLRSQPVSQKLSQLRPVVGYRETGRTDDNTGESQPRKAARTAIIPSSRRDADASEPVSVAALHSDVKNLSVLLRAVVNEQSNIRFLIERLGTASPTNTSTTNEPQFGGDYSATDISRLPPGHTRPRSMSHRIQTVNTVAHIDEASTLVYYHDYSMGTMKKMSQFACYLWEKNVQGVKNWVQAEKVSWLDQIFADEELQPTNISGLALFFWAKQNEQSSRTTFNEKIGQLYISLMSHVVVAAFDRNRTELYATWVPALANGLPGRTTPKYGRPVREPPVYMTASFVQRLGYNEYAFTRKIIENACKGARAGGSKSVLRRKRSRDSYNSLVDTNSPGSGNSNSSTRTVVAQLSAEDEENYSCRFQTTSMAAGLVRHDMNKARNKSKEKTYESFLVHVRKLQNRGQAGGNSRVHSLKWKRFKTNPNYATYKLSEPQDWVVPLATVDPGNTAGIAKNSKDYAQLKLAFPEMHCTVHYERRVEPPADGTPAHAEYLEERGSASDIYYSTSDDISFHDLALDILSTYCIVPQEDFIPAVTMSSEYSLRTIHILGLGIRGAVLSAIHGQRLDPPTQAACWGVTTAELLEVTDFRAPMLYGAKTRSTKPTKDSKEDSKTRDQIDQNKFTIKYEEYRKVRKHPQAQLPAAVPQGSPLGNSSIPSTAVQTPSPTTEELRSEQLNPFNPLPPSISMGVGSRNIGNARQTMAQEGGAVEVSRREDNANMYFAEDGSLRDDNTDMYSAGNFS